MAMMARSSERRRTVAVQRRTRCVMTGAVMQTTVGRLEDAWWTTQELLIW
jgi:hypothetical protein